MARFGVGYDNVDLAACTRAGVLVTITPDGVRRPVATSVLGYMLALSLRMFDKDRLTRASGWANKLDVIGSGLMGRTLGIVGLGNIGREIVRLARPLGIVTWRSTPTFRLPTRAQKVSTLWTSTPFCARRTSCRLIAPSLRKPANC